MRTITNQRGGMAALLSVIVLSTIMVATLSSFYVYLENRARFQQRIRMNHQMGYIMDDMGKRVAQARHAYLAGNSTCPPGTEARYLDCTQVCMAPTPTGADNSLSHSLCVKNTNLNKITKGADYFCAYNSDGGTSLPSYCNAVADTWEPQESVMVAVSDESHDVQPNRIKNWFHRLDKFYDTTIVQNAPVLAETMYPFLEAEFQPPKLFGWLIPQKASANQDPDPYPDRPFQMQLPGPGGGGSTDCNVVDPPQNCPNAKVKTTIGRIGGTSGCSPTSTDERCKRCSGHDRKLGGCLKVSLCPPWLTSDECRGQSDKRIHQMIKVDMPVASAAAPSVPSNPPAGWGSCPDECVAYENGGLCQSFPVQGGCRVDCSGNGTIYYLCR